MRSFKRFENAAEDTTDAYGRLSAVWNKEPYPVGDQKLVRKFDRWRNEKRRDKMASYIKLNTANSWNNSYIQTSSTTSTAYTNVTYAVPYGTTQVTFPQFNYTDAEWQEYEQTRRPPPKEFNRYINGSDLLEEFIEWVGKQGVRQSEFTDLPVDLFIKWLVIRACEEDQEEPNVVLELPAPAAQPRCLGCQQFMKRSTVIPLHGSQCADRHFARTELVRAA